MAQLADRVGLESEGVTADVIEVNEFPEFAEQCHIQGVPKIGVPANG
jgi:hypothetical protein